MPTFAAVKSRDDGTYVVDLNGLPYHVTPDEPELFDEVKASIAAGATVEAVTDNRPPELTADELVQVARAVRDAEISASQWLVERHRDQVDAGSATTLTAAQYSTLLVYRQALRDWPTVRGFPKTSTQPPAPDWLAAAEADNAV